MMPRKQNRMTIQKTPKKLPPMTKAIRAFVAGMQFPEPPAHGFNPNVELTAFAVVMLLFAHNLKEDSDTATCDPSHQQLADILHCSKSSIERRVKKFRDAGFLTSRPRGDGQSSVYTLWRKPSVDAVQPRHPLTALKSFQPRHPQGSAPSPSTFSPVISDFSPVIPTVQPLHPVTNTGEILSGKEHSGEKPSGTSSTGETVKLPVGWALRDGVAIQTGGPR
jgi:biotin operon repressor